MYRRAFLLAVLAFAATRLAAQPHPHAHGRAIVFPDVPGLLTLVTDLHIHSAFSDGDVWPNVRVQEALRDGLDVMATTEHLEYLPHHADIPFPDRNRAFEIAREAAEGHDLMVVHGSEITRRMPPGHSNALFIEDANLLLVDDSVEVFRAAARQGAFVFWNHPNWIPQRSDGVATLTEMHRQLLAEGLLHGIEVVNDVTYSDEALQIALDHDLTIMGTSDIHSLVDWQFGIAEGGHRPVTLVFARERTAAALREALFARRTAVYFNDKLIGRAEHLMPLLEASAVVREAIYVRRSSVARVSIENVSSAPLLLLNESAYTFHDDADLIVLPPHATTEIEVKTLERRPEFALAFRVLNAVTAPGQHPLLTLTVRPTWTD